MFVQFPSIQLTFFSTVIAIVCAYTFTTGTFKKLPMTSSGILDSTVIRRMENKSSSHCFVECRKDSSCLGVQQIDQFSCNLLNEIGSCTLASKNEPVVPYYQNDVLSKMEMSKMVNSNKASATVDPSVIWKIDCLSTFCRHSALVGLGNGNEDIGKDVDWIFCSRYGGDLEFDLENSVSVDIRNAEAGQCPVNMAVTALWDASRWLGSPDLMKCSPLKNGWKVDYDKCETIPATGTNEVICQQLDGKPTFIVEMHGPPTDSRSLDDMKCCALSK